MPISRRNFLKAAVSGLASVISPAEQELLASTDYKESFPDLRLADAGALESIVADREHILKEAKEADLSPIFLASVIYDHRRDANRLTDLADKLLSMVRDQSMGEGQIRPSVAALTDGLNEGVNFRQHMAYRKMLDDPAMNVYYTARYLRFLLQKEHRFPEITKEELLQNPKAMAIIATEYRSHPTETSNEKAKPSYYGYRVIAGIAEDSPLYGVLGINPRDSGRLASQYLNQNVSGIIEARKNYEAENIRRTGKRAGFSA